MPAHPAPTFLLLAGALVLGSACHRDQVARYKVPKEASVPAAPFSHGEALPAGAREGGLRWTLPQGWTQGEGNSLRFATLRPPVPGKVEVSVVVLPGAAGGELANVNRWRGQIGLGPLDEKALEKERRALSTRAGGVNVYDFTSEGGAKSRVVAALLTAPDGNSWFLKLNGDAGPVAQALPDFMKLLGSLRLDEAR